MNAEEIELMRLAAKAASVQVQDDTDGTLQARPILSVPYDCHGMLTAIEWNPLRDDATAFRLGVQLRIDHEFEEDKVVAWFVAPRPGWDNGMVSTWTEPLGADPYAAVRRAIVQAAASMLTSNLNSTTG